MEVVDMVDKINSLYNLIGQKNDEISRMFLSFITKANELVELSNDDYQVERSFKLNKISLRGFVLDSPCCNSLKSNNITNYSIDELKDYLSKYESTYNEDCSKYYLALSLYELLEKIEQLIDSKIELGLSLLTDILPNLKDIKLIDNSKYNELYLNSKKQVEDFRFDENTYNMCIYVLNDVFNYYINGYPDVSDYN